MLISIIFDLICAWIWFRSILHNSKNSKFSYLAKFSNLHVLFHPARVLDRGRVRNLDLRVPSLNTGSTLEWVILINLKILRVPGTRGTRSNVAPVSHIHSVLCRLVRYAVLKFCRNRSQSNFREVGTEFASHVFWDMNKTLSLIFVAYHRLCIIHFWF